MSLADVEARLKHNVARLEAARHKMAFSMLAELHAMSLCKDIGKMSHWAVLPVVMPSYGKHQIFKSLGCLKGWKARTRKATLVGRSYGITDGTLPSRGKPILSNLQCEMKGSQACSDSEQDAAMNWSFPPFYSVLGIIISL